MKYLGKSEFLCGASLGIADLALFSALKQLNLERKPSTHYIKIQIISFSAETTESYDLYYTFYGHAMNSSNGVRSVIVFFYDERYFSLNPNQEK